MTDNSAPAADRRSLAEPLALALVVGAMATIMLASHRAGHWWGDDWALYLRQADGLVSGHPGRVLTQNEFAVEMSNGAAFSPALYPWGFPLVLTPFVAIWGTDIDRLAIVPVLSACAFSVAWYLLARRRIGFVPALGGAVAVTLSPLLLGWTELIQSEWTFLAVATATLVALDRLVAADRLLGASARLGTLIGLGLGTAAAFSVRREGLALAAAIGAAQVAAAIGARRRLDGARVRRIAAPHLSALTAVLVLQWLLPTPLVPRYSGTSPANMWRFHAEHADHLLEVVGLKRPWEAEPTVFQNALVGWLVGGAFLAVATAGVVWAAWRRCDVHLAAYAVAAFVIGGSFRVPVNRYVASVAPVLLLLALHLMVRVMVRATGRFRSLPAVAPTAIAAAVVLAIAAGNLANAHLRIERATDFAAAGSIEWGPTHPKAVEMFDQVRALTGPDDVVAAPKARAMTFATDRLAVQVDDNRSIPPIELALIVTERGTQIDRTLAADRSFERIWSNERFAIFRPR